MVPLKAENKRSHISVISRLWLFFQWKFNVICCSLLAILCTRVCLSGNWFL